MTNESRVNDEIDPSFPESDGTAVGSPRVSIVIVNWNSKDYLRDCLLSITAVDQVTHYEIIVIDSGSFDGSAQMVAAEFPGVGFMQSELNLGFARANNEAAQQARAPLLLFLNPDTSVRTGFVGALHHHYVHLDDAGVVGCRLLNTDQTLQSSSVMPLPTIANQILDSDALQIALPRLSIWLSARTFEHAQGPVRVEAVSGACMLVSKAHFEAIGGFSPEYFMYGEDLDLCYKSLRAGRSNYFVNDISITHHGGGSARNARSDFSTVMMRESLSALMRKMRGPCYAHAYRSALLLTSLARLGCLLAAAPFAYAAGAKTGRHVARIRKWFAILRWSVGIERWSQRHPVDGA